MSGSDGSNDHGTRHESDEVTEKGDKAEWCPKRNIYLNGVVPDNSNDAQEYISETLASSSSPSPKSLRIFGYGSLCWKPGSSDDTLSKTDQGVTTQLGRAVGWRRCWAQKSADHRGTPEFLGLVCTLLSDEEVTEIIHATTCSLRSQSQAKYTVNSPSMTEGLIYTIPPHLITDCLAELDFREKGGYSRDVIDVVESESGTIVKALLYRGTPENPAFSIRALLDPYFAAAVMAVAVGPSGKNDEYLLRLDNFLNDATQTGSLHTSTTAETTANRDAKFEQETGDTLTRRLASMAQAYQRNHHLYFLFGSGSNQHDQLFLQSAAQHHYNAPNLVNGDEAHSLKDIILAVPKMIVKGPKMTSLKYSPRPIRLYAGGGHSALLTEGGEFYLWGWNDMGQLGRRSSAEKFSSDDNTNPSPHECDIAVVDSDFQPVLVKPLANIKVEMAALGHGHTIVIEKDSNLLYGFGDNRRGQVSGEIPKAKMDGGDGLANNTYLIEATAPSILSRIRFKHVAAGLFHSAAITEQGELVTFGEQKYGQCLINNYDKDGDGKLLRWRPEDGSILVKVSCGRRHTIVLDEHGRVWSMGNDNKYGQLGRNTNSSVYDGAGKKDSQIPMLVDGALGQKGSGCVDIDCGWSHNIAMVQSHDEVQNNGIVVYGWGRNDKAQLGNILDGKSTVDIPQLLHTRIGEKDIFDVCCGGESIMALTADRDIYGCGWNEHGNLSTGNTDDMQEFTKIEGIHRICSPPPNDTSSRKKNVIMAAGGAHFLAMQYTSLICSA